MKVLFLAAEATPLAKVGGLADVAGELPQALSYLGMDLRLWLPLHTTIDRSQYELREIAKIEVAHDHAFHLATIFETQVGEVTVWLVDGPPVEASPGVYGELTRDAAKYTFTNLALFTLCETLDWIPEILHANDWHAAVAVMYLNKLREHDARWARTSSLFTIHNLPYMGLGAEQVLASYKAPILASTLLPEWAQKAPLPQGILQADWVSTVSPTYALEIQTPEFGSGIEALLEARRENLSGILNGIDPGVWNPGEDQTLARPFTLETHTRDE